MTNSLTEKIIIDCSKSDFDIFDESYDFYNQELKNRENRPNLLGRFLFIDERATEEGRDHGFWHVSSIGEDDTKFDMYPCQNHPAQASCRFQCDSQHIDNFLAGLNSVPCIYRAHKINWVKEIIDLVNTDRNHPNLRIWQQVSRNGGKRLLIRYVNNPIDYVLVFHIEYTPNKSDIRWYRLITGYPVVLKPYKRRFDKEFAEFKARKK